MDVQLHNTSAAKLTRYDLKPGDVFTHGTGNVYLRTEVGDVDEKGACVHLKTGQTCWISEDKPIFKVVGKFTGEFRQ